MTAMSKIHVLHGPNLNLLGMREPAYYGHETLLDINTRLEQNAKPHELYAYQSNSESELIEWVHRSFEEGVSGIIINPAAFTHTSIALRDALLAVAIPFVEVHLSNIYARESFRHQSYFSDIALGVVSGLGAKGYDYALDFLIKQIES